MHAAVLEAIEVSYGAVGAGDVDAWLRSVVVALNHVIGRNCGVLGYRFDARGDPARWSLSQPFVHDGPQEIATTTMGLFAVAPPAFRTTLYRAENRAHSLSELNGFTLEALPFGDAPEIVRKLRIIDFLGLNAGNPDGLGAMFASAHDAPRALRPAERWSFSRLAGHLAAAHRLVRAISRLAPAAVLDGGGRLLDVAPRHEKQVTPLRAAVRVMDRARGSLRRKSANDALDTWRALVLGRYSLLDRFESDGKRFVVAYENAPGALDPRGLTARESAVAGLLALALPNKLIAYELGVSEGTVRAQVHSVLRKLDVRSRAAAIDRLAPQVSAAKLSLGAGAPSVVVFSEPVAEATERQTTLTAAERDVAKLAARGMSTFAIAKRRQRSPSTIAHQLASVFRKLGVRSRAELARKLLTS